MLSSYNPNAVVRITDQFTTNREYKVHRSWEFCAPANKTPGPGPTPVQPPLGGPFYECFGINGPDPDGNAPPYTINTQFGADPVSVGIAGRLCVPTLKNGAGDMSAPPLVCYQANGTLNPDTFYHLKTQFGSETPHIKRALRLCVQATKAGKSDGPPAGLLSGVYDASIFSIGPVSSHHHCIFSIEHDNASQEAKTAAQCYDDIDTSDPNAEPINAPPGETPGDLIPGPPLPPPYKHGEPTKFHGGYQVAGDVLTQTACFADIGGTLGPSMIMQLVVPNAAADLPTGILQGNATLYPNQSAQQCSMLLPYGPPDPPLRLTLYKAGTPGESPWRAALPHPSRSVDFDNDGCTDSDELDKRKKTKCGDDPYNPLDPASGSPLDVSGTYDVVVTLDSADWDKNTNAPIGGSYLNCKADVQQVIKELTTRIYCYSDSPTVAVNPQAAGNMLTCPPAATNRCGDGLAGAAPPGRATAGGPINFGDVDDVHTVLTGHYDNSDNTVRWVGCFEDRDGAGNLGNMYFSATFDAHRGKGEVLLAPFQSLADCQSGTNITNAATVPIDAVRQALKGQNRDFDVDGCPDKKELGDTATVGGLRDPSNHYDYMNPTKDGLNRVDDIVAVVNQYFIDDLPGPIDYKSQTDRTALIGGNVWNLGPPNGQQRVDDIVNQVRQYFHDC
jgi:hypothetical protein